VLKISITKYVSPGEHTPGVIPNSTARWRGRSIFFGENSTLIHTSDNENATEISTPGPFCAIKRRHAAIEQQTREYNPGKAKNLESSRVQGF